VATLGSLATHPRIPKGVEVPGSTATRPGGYWFTSVPEALGPAGLVIGPEGQALVLPVAPLLPAPDCADRCVHCADRCLQPFLVTVLLALQLATCLSMRFEAIPGAAMGAVYQLMLVVASGSQWCTRWCTRWNIFWRHGLHSPHMLSHMSLVAGCQCLHRCYPPAAPNNPCVARPYGCFLVRWPKGARWAQARCQLPAHCR
jgi:hypothetical protein